MLSAREVRAALAPIDPRVLAGIYAQLRAGRALEVQRMLADQLGDGSLAAEVTASLVRREVTGK